MFEFFGVALLAGNFLMLAIIADALSRIYDILDCWDKDDDDDDDWPDPDLNH